MAASGGFDELIQEIKKLVNQYSLEEVKKALAVIEGIESKKQPTD